VVVPPTTKRCTTPIQKQRAPTAAAVAKYKGTVVQVADFNSDPPTERLPGRGYQDLLYGSMYSVAGA